jgi:hypothetical protein
VDQLEGGVTSFEISHEQLWQGVQIEELLNCDIGAGQNLGSDLGNLLNAVDR